VSESAPLGDVKAYSDSDLLEEAGAIDRTKFPIRWEMVSKEIVRRGLEKSLEWKPPVAADFRIESAYSPHFERIWRVIQREAEVPNSGQNSKNFLAVLTLSLFLFGLTASSTGGLLFAIILSAAILAHELGHVLAMKVLGYRNVGILFVPFLGAFAGGSSPESDRKNEALVALAGPAMGLLSCAAALVLYAALGYDILLQYAKISLGLNVLNLLPFSSLDGGAFLRETILYRSVFLDLAFTVVGIGALGSIAFYDRDIFLALFCFALLVGNISTFRWKFLAARFRRLHGTDFHILDLEVSGSIYEMIKSSYPDLALHLEEEGQEEKSARLILYVWKYIKDVRFHRAEATQVVIVAGAFFGVLFFLLSILFQGVSR